MKKFAVFENGKQVSKAHSTWDAAAIEAYEKGNAVWYVYGKARLAPGFEIKEIADVTA
jgi:hypothetical protein